MKTYEVQLKNKSLFSKNRILVKADNFYNDVLTSCIIFRNEKNDNVAMFKRTDIDYIVELPGGKNKERAESYDS